MTTRGLKEEEFKTIGEIIVSALTNKSEENLRELKEKVLEITKRFPLNEVWYE